MYLFFVNIVSFFCLLQNAPTSRSVRFQRK